MIAQLPRDTVRRGHELVAVRERSDHTIRLVFDVSGASAETVADLVVLALPFSTLRHVDLKHSGLSQTKRHVISLADIEDGEVLVAASTSPSWTPVFGRVSAVVVDIGGIMCHAAILAREYALPTVVGTGSASKRIQTGDRIRVDGHTGVVTVLD